MQQCRGHLWMQTLLINVHVCEQCDSNVWKWFNGRILRAPFSCGKSDKYESTLEGPVSVRIKIDV